MKRSGIALLVFSIIVVFAGSSMAGPPLNGIYDSTDLGGLVQLGRYSESFLAPDGSMNPGATVNAQSWDGTDLGLQWKYWCGTQVAPAVLLIDNVNSSGNGNRTYMKTYVGGFIWMSGTGPWANGDPDYPGIIDTYTEFVTIQYVAWERVASVSNVDASAHFDGYSGSCMTFGIGNGSEVGSTDFGEMLPADYPALLQQSTCDPVMVYGSWWDMFTITFTITACATPVEEATWGAVKSIYAE
jgi:hypothetical protein